jgi:hypothetical protein
MMRRRVFQFVFILSAASVISLCAEYSNTNAENGAHDSHWIETDPCHSVSSATASATSSKTRGVPTPQPTVRPTSGFFTSANIGKNIFSGDFDGFSELTNGDHDIVLPKLSNTVTGEITIGWRYPHAHPVVPEIAFTFGRSNFTSRWHEISFQTVYEDLALNARGHFSTQGRWATSVGISGIYPTIKIREGNVNFLGLENKDVIYRGHGVGVDIGAHFQPMHRLRILFGMEYKWLRFVRAKVVGNSFEKIDVPLKTGVFSPTVGLEVMF